MPTIANCTIRHGFCGPFLNGSDLYFVGQDASGTLDLYVWKSDDGGSSWTAQDTANAPDFTAVLRIISVFHEGTTLHIATVGGSPDYYYHTFDMSTDAWGTTMEGISTGITQAVVFFMSLVRDSTGDLVLLFNGEGDKVMGASRARVDYIRKTGGSWGSVTQVDNSTISQEKDWIAGPAVLGANDRVHFFFNLEQDGDAFQRTVTSGDSLETFPSAFDADVPTTNELSVFGRPGINYDDGGTARIRVAYQDVDGTISIAECDSADAPTMSTTTGASDSAVDTQVTAVSDAIVIASMAVQTKKLHLMYARDSDQDIYLDTNDDDAGWGTDTEEQDAVNATTLSCNIYDRSGDKLGYLYMDSGTATFQEKDLGGGGSPAVDTMLPEMMFMSGGC